MHKKIVLKNLCLKVARRTGCKTAVRISMPEKRGQKIHPNWLTPWNRPRLEKCEEVLKSSLQNRTQETLQVIAYNRDRQTKLSNNFQFRMTFQLTTAMFA